MPLVPGSRTVPLTWVGPTILPVGLPQLVNRFWAEHGAPGVDVTVHVYTNGRPRRNQPDYAQREPPYADVHFTPTHHMSAARSLGAAAGSCWLFAQWRHLSEALISELQLTGIAASDQSPEARRYAMDTRHGVRKRFLERIAEQDDRMGQPRDEIGGVVGALWGRRLKGWARYRRALKQGGDFAPHEYPRAVLDDLRARECGGQYALAHLVQHLMDDRYPGVIPYGETEQQVQATHRFLRNQRYLLRYHLLNACPDLGVWRTVLARNPGRDGSRRVYHFFTHGERTRLLAHVAPRLPAPKTPPWTAWRKPWDSAAEEANW